MAKKDRIITVFLDDLIENQIKLRDQFNKIIVPELFFAMKEIEEVRFEFITGGLLFGKVLGKKAYKIDIRTDRDYVNTILNSKIVIDRVIVNGQEYRIKYPTFYFANPDKITVYIRDLIKKTRKGIYRGKSFRSIFWQWDGHVTVRVNIKTKDGLEGYIDLLKIIFVYKGNASAALTFANEQRRKYKKRIKLLLNYMRVLYGNEIAELVAQASSNEVDANEAIARIKEVVEDRRKLNFILRVVERIRTLRKEINTISRLMNRNSGANFLVIVEYNKLYNPMFTKDGIKNEPTRFYAEIKYGHEVYEERLVDEFGNQIFAITSEAAKTIRKMGFVIEKTIIENMKVKKEFQPAGLRGFFNHKIVATARPAHKEVYVNRVDDLANKELLWRLIGSKRDKLVVTGYMARRNDKKYVVYVVKPETGAGRVTILNYDHRHEGQDRVLVHLDNNKELLFIHKI